MTSYIYHERQLGGLCGVHCLNNLLQGPHFGPGDLAEIGVQLDNEENQLVGGGVQYNVDSSADGGNFSIQVLARALERFELELLPAKHPRARDLMKDPAKAAEAFLCQYRDHWFAIREVGSCWWNLNSTRTRPGLVSGFHLAAWLGQLSAEGYSIFLVCGKALPQTVPVPTRAPGEPIDETFHEIVELLEWANSGEDNPLAGGDHAQAQADLLLEAHHRPLRPVVSGSGGASPSRPRQEPPEVSRLREMGFGEPQIQAALELTSSSPARASELLLRARSVDQGVERDPARLAAKLQEAVQALDGCRGDVAEAILHLVALVCCGEDDVRRAASKQVDPAGLAEFLFSVLAQRERDWTPPILRAANVVVEHLVVWPERTDISSAAAKAQTRAASKGKAEEGPSVISLDSIANDWTPPDEEDDVVQL